LESTVLRGDLRVPCGNLRAYPSTSFRERTCFLVSFFFFSFFVINSKKKIHPELIASINWLHPWAAVRKTKCRSQTHCPVPSITRSVLTPPHPIARTKTIKVKLVDSPAVRHKSRAPSPRPVFLCSLMSEPPLRESIVLNNKS